MGFRSPANKSAQIGSIVHKALEILAHRKLSEQNGVVSFFDAELDNSFTVNAVTPEAATEASYHYYVGLKEYDYKDTDYRDCLKLVNNVLLWRGGMFSPLKQKILSAEQYFDFTIEKPWAKYKYGEVEGYLSVKGTLDLIVERPQGVLEIVDWKTGKPMFDWNTGKDKTYADLYKDPQLRLYHYAASRLYPDAKQIFLTIFYIKDAPYSICFEEKDIAETEKMIEKKYNEIRHTQRPKLIYPDWRCSKLCYFGKNSFEGPTTDYKQSICNVVKNEVLTLGIDRVTENRRKADAGSYGSGGGRTTKED